jgi:MscS family membrane protein
MLAFQLAQWPSWFEDRPWLHHDLWGNELWQYILFFFYVLAAVVLSKLCDIIMSRYLRAAAAKTKSQLDDKLIEILRGPLKLTVFLFLMHLGVQLINKPEWMERYLRHTVGIIIAIAITYVLIKLADVIFEVTSHRFKRQDPRASDQILILIRKAVKIFIVVTAVLVTADNNGIKINGVLASLGITGLAVALAAQETLSNLLGSIVILADRPFFLGDKVKIGPDEGVVEHVGIRSTRLRTANGDVITIPNRTVAAASVLNFSKTTQQLTK